MGGKISKQQSLQIQEQYRQGNIDFTKLTKKQSDALWTPQVEKGVVLVDNNQIKFKVYDTEKTKCVMTMLGQETIGDGGCCIFYIFDFDPIKNALSFKRRKLVTNTDMIDRAIRRRLGDLYWHMPTRMKELNQYVDTLIEKTKHIPSLQSSEIKLS